ncbi:MAG TPA: DUF1569 domain-containing protein [Terracidiphilus sp.]|nr:DUF1569 domain-containing protein [Terracidiphilus sp.]
MKRLSDPQSRQEILVRLGQVQPGTPRCWGAMTAPQMICHLRDSFLGVMGDMPMAIPPFTWMRLTKTYALYAPFKWPHGVPTRPEFDQVHGQGTPPAEFEADVKSLHAAIAKFTAQPRGFDFCPHPIFGRMSEKQWMRWSYLHTDHHLRQFGA